MITLLWLIMVMGFFVWQLCSLAWSLGVRTGAINAIRAELHPFRWVLCAMGYVLEPIAISHSYEWWRHVAFVLGMWMCWSARHENDDDDRWKRRMDAATGYVREVAGRLTIVPEPA